MNSKELEEYFWKEYSNLLSLVCKPGCYTSIRKKQVTVIIKLIQFKIQWFLRFPEFTEFIDSSTPFRENSIVLDMNQSVRPRKLPPPQYHTDHHLNVMMTYCSFVSKCAEDIENQRVWRSKKFWQIIVHKVFFLPDVKQDLTRIEIDFFFLRNVFFKKPQGKLAWTNQVAFVNFLHLFRCSVLC